MRFRLLSASRCLTCRCHHSLAAQSAATRTASRRQLSPSYIGHRSAPSQGSASNRLARSSCSEARCSQYHSKRASPPNCEPTAPGHAAGRTAETLHRCVQSLPAPDPTSNLPSAAWIDAFRKTAPPAIRFPVRRIAFLPSACQAAHIQDRHCSSRTAPSKTKSCCCSACSSGRVVNEQK